MSEVKKAPEAAREEPVSAPKKKEKPAAAPRPGGFSVYLGPTIYGVIQKGTIFSGSRQEAIGRLGEKVQRHPLIGELIVDSATLPEDRIKVKTPGTLLYDTYHRLAAGNE